MLSLVLSSSLVSLGYSLPAVGQQQVFPSSGAVYKETLSVLAGVYNRIRARNATAGDFQSAGIALRILFAHWEETGINARIQAHIAEQAELLRSYSGPADEQVHALYAQLSLAGLLFPWRRFAAF